MMKRITGCLPILMLLAAIVCAAQPPVYTISDVDSGKFNVNSDTWLDDGTYIACGRAGGSRSDGRVNGGYFILPPGAKKARIIPMIDQEIDEASQAESWIASDGAIVSIVRNKFRPQTPIPGLEFIVWRAEPDLSTVYKYKIPYQSFALVDAAFLKNDEVCLYIDDYKSGQVLLVLDRNLGLRRTVLLDGPMYTPGTSRKISALSGGDILMVHANDGSAIVTRLDSNLTVEWSRTIANLGRWILPEDPHRVGVLERKDGTMVLAIAQYDYTWAFIHLGAGGDILGSWTIRALGTSGLMHHMVENDEGGIVFATGMGPQPEPYIPFVGTINANWTDAALFDCTSYARPLRRYASMNISAASRGRIGIVGRLAAYASAVDVTIEVGSAEWNVGGEMPCGIRRTNVDVIQGAATLSIASVASADYTPKFVGTRYKQYLGEPRYAAADTYPCTSINGTTWDTAVLSGNAYETGIDVEPDLIRVASQTKAGTISAAIVGIGATHGLRMHVLPSITSDTTRGFAVDLGEKIVETPKLAIDADGLVALAVLKEPHDTVVVLTSSAPASDGIFGALTRTAIAVPDGTKLLDVVRARNRECALLFRRGDTLFVMNYVPNRYESLTLIDKLAIPVAADTAYWIDRSRIMTRNPDGIITLNERNYEFSWNRDRVGQHYVGTLAEGGGEAYAVFRLPDPDSSIAIAYPASGYAVTLPSILVDSVTNILPLPASKLHGNWVLGRIGDDACLFKLSIEDSCFLMRYWRISREGVKLIPYTLDQRPNGSLTLWCERVAAGKTTFIGIPTNATGQTACSEGWSSLRMMRDYPRDTLYASKRMIGMPSISAPNASHDVAQTTIPLVPIGPCGDLTMGVVEPIAGTAIKGEANPAIHDMIPSTFLPATLRSYTIRDVQGRIMCRVQDAVPGSIPTHDLPPGVYVMIMEHDAGKITSLPFMVMQR